MKGLVFTLSTEKGQNIQLLTIKISSLYSVFLYGFITYVILV